MTTKQYQKKIEEIKATIETNKAEMEKLWEAPHTAENGERWEYLDDENWRLKEAIKQINTDYVRRNWTAVDYSYYEMVSRNAD